MKLENIDKVMAGILIIFGLSVLANWVRAGDYYRPSEEAMAPAMETCTAKAAVAGQQNFKATTHLQWSGAISSDSCSTAAQIGLGLQIEKVFITINVADNIFSSLESDPMVSVSASGVF